MYYSPTLYLVVFASNIIPMLLSLTTSSYGLLLTRELNLFEEQGESICVTARFIKHQTSSTSREMLQGATAVIQSSL